MLYALALIPVGFIADRADRPRLLAAGAAAWSLLTMGASKVTDFNSLLGMRVGLAAAQATQNPVCFSLIPELFPRRRNLAMSMCAPAVGGGQRHPEQALGVRLSRPRLRAQQCPLSAAGAALHHPVR